MHSICCCVAVGYARSVEIELATVVDVRSFILLCVSHRFCLVGMWAQTVVEQQYHELGIISLPVPSPFHCPSVSRTLARWLALSSPVSHSSVRFIIRNSCSLYTAVLRLFVYIRTRAAVNFTDPTKQTAGSSSSSSRQFPGTQ